MKSTKKKEKEQYQRRQKIQVKRDRRNIARLYLQRVGQPEIAEQLGISQPTVSRDLKIIQDQWKKERVHDINERKNIELAKIDALELEYYEAWRRSQEDAVEESMKQKGAKTKRIKGGKEGKEFLHIVPVEAQKKTKGQVGDPRYLRGVEWCINKRCEILGLDAPKRTKEEGQQRDADIAVLSSIPAELIAPDFFRVYRDILVGNSSEYVIKGGRGSTKSSFVSLIIIYLIVNNPLFNALVLRNNANTLRDSVYSQITWAINMLGLDDMFKSTMSPLQVEYIPTGQRIYFRGADEPKKLKGIIPKVGYIAVMWLEELDQFRGQPALRSIRQSAIRGGDDAYQFLTYNPPPSVNNWVNKYVLIPKKGQYQHDSTYLGVPADWLGQPFIDEAEHLKEVNPKAYAHEYMGEVIGTGGQVFDNIEVRAITDKEIATFGDSLHGNDWGYFPDPFSYGKMYYDAARMILYIYGEYRSNKESNKQTYEAIQKNGYNPDELLIADSAEPKSIADYSEYGARIRGAEKGAGSVVYSMKWLQMRVKIVIDPKRAPYHAQEFVGYELEMDKNGEYISAYPDKDNHSIDDTRYATNLIWRRRGK